jgi:hypothetical protein
MSEALQEDGRLILLHQLFPAVRVRLAYLLVPKTQQLQMMRANVEQ